MKHGLAEYFRFYNSERIHQALDYKTPDEVYASATGGGARIVDKYSQKKDTCASYCCASIDLIRGLVVQCLMDAL